MARQRRTFSTEFKLDAAKLVVMDYYNWHRPHQFNNGVPPAKAENLSNLLSGTS